MNKLKRYSLLTIAYALVVLDMILGTLIIVINWLSRQLVKGEEAARRKAEEYKA